MNDTTLPPADDAAFLARLRGAADHAPSATMDLDASYRRTRRRAAAHRAGALGAVAACVAGAAFAMPGVVDLGGSGGQHHAPAVAAGAPGAGASGNGVRAVAPVGLVAQPGLTAPHDATAELLADGTLLVDTGLRADADTAIALAMPRSTLDDLRAPESAPPVPPDGTPPPGEGSDHFRFHVLRVDDALLADIRAAGTVAPWLDDAESDSVTSDAGDTLFASVGSRTPSVTIHSRGQEADGSADVARLDLGCLQPLPAGLDAEICVAAAMVDLDTIPRTTVTGPGEY
ncbi:hypothetical protein CLV28_2715 [Sediminihabitans luteus]|uniref:Uncharacterized protein n=1 Tax=Sediminihabitans luteus TaxID=1138585 RepID=A0A2M9CCY8_9CELL|nr:hypothetical protein [Sediminihabitans luteus]PJJ69252.1 hypothetical protein CLV28_2715 [Sediminihabitans luteus]GII98928.1 hypothetical protein Slu03_13060 [Sediminihabitans luteus]